MDPQVGGKTNHPFSMSGQLQAKDKLQTEVKGVRGYSNDSDDLFGSSAENNLAFMSTTDADFASGPETSSTAPT